MRRALRASEAVNSARFAVSIRKVMMALNGPEFLEDEDGRRIRVWGDPYEDYVTNDDVRAWLSGQRVVEDLRDGLEFVREGYIKMLVKEGYLRKDPVASYYWITRACAERYDLPKVMGCEFPK